MTIAFGSALSNEEKTPRALADACDRALASLGRARGGAASPKADLALSFLTPHHARRTDLASLARDIVQRTGARSLIGCTAEGVIGAGSEVERRPAFAVLLGGGMAEAALTPFAVTQEQLAGETAEVPAAACFLVLADPFSIDPNGLIERLETASPGAVAIGGLASGASAPGQNRLFLGDEVREEGAVGLAVRGGGVEVRALVSQGCRPIGDPKVITKADRNVIHALGGKPALEVLASLLEALPKRDRGLAKRALHVGRVVNEAQETFHRGDFLIRNLVGIDPHKGAIAVADHFRAGQTIQFHVRDAETATEDLASLLEGERERAARGEARPAAAAALFSCNGRGTRLFGAPNHDSDLIRKALGDIPLAGFFCAGEIGPIGGKNFLHGYTSSIALFSEEGAAAGS